MASKARNTGDASLNMFRFTIEEAPVAVFWMNREAGFTYVNAQAYRSLGYTREELMSLRLWDIDPVCSVDVWDEIWKKTVKGGTVETRQANSIHRRKDGSEFPVEIAAKHFWFGETEFHVAFARDITERMREEDRLRKYEHIVSSSTDLMSFLDRNYIYRAVNDTYLAFFSKTRDQIVGHSLAELLGEEVFLNVLKSKIDRCLRGERIRFQHWLRLPGGPLRFWDVRYDPYRGASGEISGVVIVVRDITDQKRTEAALQEGEERLRLAVSGAKVGVWEWNIETDRLTWSKLLKTIFGWPPEKNDLTFQAYLAAVHPGDRARVEANLRKALAQRSGHEHEFRILRPDGSLRWIAGKGRAEYDAEGQPLRMIGVALDITERKQIEEALSTHRSYLQAVVESTSDAVFAKDLEGRYVLFNTAGGRATGKAPSEVLGKDDYAIFPRAEAEAVIAKDREIIEGGVAVTFEETITIASGEVRTFLTTKGPLLDAEGKAFGLYGVARDMTDRKRAEEEKVKLELQLLQAQKMESIGRLAGGVAHDFNNMLSVILGYSELIKEQLPADHPVMKGVFEIEKAAKRSKNTTQQLLAFSRKQIVSPKAIDLNDRIADIQKTLSHLIGEDVVLRFDSGKGLWKIDCDATQIDQIVLNLAVNARDAMPEGGILRLETDNVVLDKAACRGHLGFRPGEYVCLSVQDNGIGMDQEILSQIFEPFFTTKDVDKGTGLGLAMVYGVVKQADGLIDVQSAPGEGTTFKIYFPRSERAAEPSEDVPKAIVSSGKGTVLLVEDDDLVRGMTRAMLNKLGYSVELAKGPKEALSIGSEKALKIDLLLTDVVMPDMTGTELKERLSKIVPGLRFLYMSGFTSNIILSQGGSSDAVHFIQKPFSLADLIKT